MTLPPYPQKYLGIVMSGLGDIFDLALRQKRMDIEQFAGQFAESKVATLLESGSLYYIDGYSAQESLSLIVGLDVVQSEPIDYRAEYWAGYILAYLQWKVNRPFRFILERIPFMDFLNLYHLYHEMAEERAVELLEKRLDIKPPLMERRIEMELTQQQLADLSGVNVRSIRAYEQGQNSMANASGETLYKLSRVLGCTVEYLIL